MIFSHALCMFYPLCALFSTPRWFVTFWPLSDYQTRAASRT